LAPTGTIESILHGRKLASMAAPVAPDARDYADLDTMYEHVDT
jgi:hypothetical protein